MRRDDGTLGDDVDEGIADLGNRPFLCVSYLGIFLGGKVEQVGEELQDRRRRRDLGQTEEEEAINAGTPVEEFLKNQITAKLL